MANSIKIFGGVSLFFLSCSFLIISTGSVNWEELSQVQDLIPETVDGDWRFMHPEAIQSFYQFKDACKHNKHLHRSHVSITALDVSDSVAFNVLPILRDYIGLFLALEVDSVLRLDDVKIPRKARRNVYGVQQIQTGYILYQVLYPKLKTSDLASICITSHDLYQDEAWNFVFGEADALNRVSVASYARYQIDADQRKALYRLMKVTTHELCHVLGLEHCQKYRCNMNGSNSLIESDSQPLHLCVDCLQKLHYAKKIDVSGRYQLLEAFYLKHHFDNEAGKVGMFLSSLE